MYLCYRLSINALKAYLSALEKAGINYIALNLRFNQKPIPIEETLYLLANELLPLFSSHDDNNKEYAQ